MHQSAGATLLVRERTSVGPPCLHHDHEAPAREALCDLRGVHLGAEAAVGQQAALGPPRPALVVGRAVQKRRLEVRVVGQVSAVGRKVDVGGCGGRREDVC